MSTPNKPENEHQEPKILRKRGARLPKKATSFQRQSLEVAQIKPQKPSLYQFTLMVIYKNLYLLGVTLLRRRLRISRKMRKFGAVVEDKLNAQVQHAGQRIKRSFSEFWARIKAPFLRIKRTYNEVKPDIASKRAKGKFPIAAYMAIAETFFRLILKILATIFNYVAPILAVIFLLTVIRDRINEPMVLALDYNGKTIGYINNESEFNVASQDVRSRVTVDGESAFEILNPHFELMTQNEFNKRRDEGQIPINAGKISKEELPDMLIRSSNADVIEAYGLYIDNEFLGAILNKNKILNEFEIIKNKSRTGKPHETLEFEKKVRLTKQGLYPLASITNEENLLSKISSFETADEIYVVKEGDTPSGISDKTGVPYEVLKNLNPKIEDELLKGMEIYTQVARPFMSVESTYTEIVEEEVKFKTVEVENATYAKGYRNIFQEGVNGTSSVTYRVSSVDGLERARVKVDEEIIKHPVDERVTVGINNPVYVPPVQTPQQGQQGQTTPTKPADVPTQPATTSGFIRPVPYGVGYVSAGINGYRGHTGMDIAVMGGTGTPILASASGVVVKALNTNVGYGRYVVIDHGNGYQTLYAHNSALYVSVGDRVSQGQVIAAMGRTGRATGVHCHFEVRLNGKIMNPANYIGNR